MPYRYEALSPESVVQLIAANYLRHGFYWYVTGTIPATKDPDKTDRKLISKYHIDIGEWERRRRKQSGIANAHYLRYQRWFILMVSEGHHPLKQPATQGGEGEFLNDCRRNPIRFQGYSISYRRAGISRRTSAAGPPSPTWHAHVRIDDQTYRKLKAYFVDIATHRTADKLANELARIPFARYAPIRRQLLNILRTINERRKQHRYEPIPHSVLKLRRIPVPVYVQSEPETQPATSPTDPA